MVVRGKRLTELTLGSKSENVIISITGLTLAGCGSLQTILLSNITTLQGTLDLSNCINIREVYADGTNLSQIKVPDGGGLEVIEYPANNKYISFRNFPVLTTEGLRIGQCAVSITDFWIENCPLLKPMKLLSDIIEAQQEQGNNHALKHIRAIGFEEEYYTADALDMLAKLADGTYEGLSAEGLAGEDPIPVLNGKITVHSKYYQDSVEELRKIFTKLNLILIGGPALRFADPEVFRVLLEATVGIDKSSRMVDYDNDGMLTEEELAAVTTLSHRRDDVYSMFVEGYNLGNELIETFDEFRYFTGLTSINGSAFTWCKSLRRISLPPNIVEIKSSAFGATAIEKLVINEGCKICGNGFISLNKKCKLIDFPSTIISIGLRPTNNGGDKLVVICRALVPPVFEGAWSYVEAGRPIAIYVPDASMLAYKSATGWSESANLIQALSTYEEQ